MQRHALLGRAALLLLFAVPAGGAMAQDVMALAYARSTGRAEFAIGRTSAAAASAARAACGERCEVVAVAPAGICLALAAEPRVTYGWSMREAGEETRAREAASERCRRGDGARQCAVLVSRCLPAVPAPAHYGDAQPAPITDPRRTIVIIHSHGSLPPDRPDPCDMDRINAPFGVPAVIHALHETTIAGLRVVVDGFCTPTRVGSVDPATGQFGKLLPRAREIGDRAAAYAAAGVPPRQIIVSGHSAGGWASLLAARDRQDVVGAAIAFAPAAWNRAAVRPPPVEALRQRRYAEMRAAPRLPALVFGFAGDDFENADDLRALAAIPGLEFVAIPEAGSPGRTCVFEPHTRLRDPCFAESQGARIRAFIAARVAAR